MAIHDRLREMRERTGMTQKAFAESLSMEQSKYNKWENGKNAPDYEALCQLADALEVTTDYLLGRTDTPKADQVDIVETTGLSADAVEMLSVLKNDAQQERGIRLLRAVNLLLENGLQIGMWDNLYHYLFSRFLFGNPVQAQENMDQDKTFMRYSNVVAFSEDLDGERLDIQREDIRNLFFTNIQNNIRDLRRFVRDPIEEKELQRMAEAEEQYAETQTKSCNTEI